MKKERTICDKVRNLSIVDTLAKFGHYPKGTTEKEALWFLSPFRDETKASFKVSVKQNYWIDFATFEGGNVIDLVIKLKQCTVKEAIVFLSSNINDFSFHQPAIFEKEKGKIEIQQIKLIQHFGLIKYLESRKIHLNTAKTYCKEVWYKNKGKTFFAIGLQNHLGGWELRNKYFKTSTSPKTYSHIKLNNDKVLVTEGMFDLFSLASILKEGIDDYDLIVLNSIAFAKQIITTIKEYRDIELYLDNDNSGNITTEFIIENIPWSIDRRFIYKDFKDANEKLMLWM